MIRHRDYQVEAVQSILRYFAENNGNPLVAMPTGTGKSVVIAMFLQLIYNRWSGQKVLALTHVKELIQQNYEKLITLWPSAPAGVYSAGLNRRDTGRNITFAGIASIARRASALFGHIDLILIDEAHLVSPNDVTMYQTVIKELRAVNPFLKVIGFTATPWRLGSGKLTEGGIFTDVCFDITDMRSFNRLVDEGYLSPLIAKHTQTQLDTDGVHMRGGEFIEKELQLAVDRDEITHAALSEMIGVAMNRKHWLIFGSGIQHVTHITDMLNDMGISAVAVHSKMEENREQVIRNIKAGKYQAIVNNNVLTTGFDYPDIDCIGVLRPTASSLLWVQMLGRGTRPVYADGWDLDTAEGRLGAIENSTKRNCLVLDFAGNTQRLGPINDPVVPRKKGKGPPGTAPVKLCGSCATWNHASRTHCVECGAEFTFSVKLKATASEQEVMRTDSPLVDIFKVDHITYSKHEKAGRPPMMKVSYFCGLRRFTEYVCFEHDKYALRKAREWWRGRTTDHFPLSTEEGLMLADKVKTPTHLRVWVNKPYPEILSHCFEGTAFGSLEKPVEFPKSHVQVATLPTFADNDIPF